MARIWRLDIAVYPPSDDRPHFCVEVFETVRSARPNRVLHFSIGNPPGEEEAEWLEEVIGAQMRTLMARTIGLQSVLEL